MSVPTKGSGPTRSAVIFHLCMKAGRHQPLTDLGTIGSKHVRNDNLVAVYQATYCFYGVPDTLHNGPNGSSHCRSSWHEDIDNGTADCDNAADLCCNLGILLELLLLIASAI